MRILCPDVEDNESLNGQLLEMEVASLLDSVSAIKARLADVLQLPANKQRITRDGVGVLQVIARAGPLGSHRILHHAYSRAAGNACKLPWISVLIMPRRKVHAWPAQAVMAIWRRAAVLVSVCVLWLGTGCKRSNGDNGRCIAGCKLPGALQCGA